MTPQERKALKLALECAERCESIDGMYSWADTITAIKEALAQPEQEPVGEAYLCDRCQTPFDGAYECPSCGHNEATKEPVYTTPPQPKEPEQEPVAWMEGESVYWHTNPSLNDWIRANGTPLYITPPQRKPLTDEEIGAILEGVNAYGTRLYTFARAIEAAHGIKGDA